jgi:DNA-binding transcriptional MerR regulator
MAVSAPTVSRLGDSPQNYRYTVDELARTVGMSPRNIRAHQARKLLGPSIRVGRTAYYDSGHVRRLEAIILLQRQGYNLVAIEAILGVPGQDPDSDKMAALLARLGVENPSLVYALTRHGVMGRGEDGVVRMVRPKALRSALDLHRAGIPTVAALQVLSEVLDSVRHIADDLVRTTSARMLAVSARTSAAGPSSWEQLDNDTVVFTQGLVGLLTEAFRVAVDNSGRVAAGDLLNGRAGLDLHVEDNAQIDIG